jgi:hypothetical protein
MPDTFAITVVFIILVTVIGTFIKGRSRDKCLMDFSQELVTLEEKSGKSICGLLRIEHTGLELTYPPGDNGKAGLNETSYILYKHEYPNIQALIRYHDELSESGKRRRERELRATYHPGLSRRLKRKIRNLFNTLRDSVMEVVNLFLGQARKTALGGAIITSQDKYISQLKQELIAVAGASFEPLLERHIGRRVALELRKADKIFDYVGILKDYTAEFVEIMDVDYRVREGEPLRKADLILPRHSAVIRHLAE